MEQASAIRLPPALVAGIAASLIATVAAPFSTGTLPWPTRLVLWSLLIGVEIAKWQLWPRLRPAAIGLLPWMGIGLVLLNALLPLELMALFAALGVDVAIAWMPIYLAALAIGAGIAVTIGATFHARAARPAAPAATASPAAGDALSVAGTTATVPARLAARAGLADLAGVDAVVAEDHYLRLYLADGGRPLVLHRFGDALAELAGEDGEQVHRGAWVAARAVAGARRDGRRWRLRLADGSEVRVADSRVAAVRARGWLR